MADVQRERIHALDNALLCDVCKSDYFVFYRDVLMDEAVINIECPGCHEEKTSIHEVNFLAWCQRYHPELVERIGRPGMQALTSLIEEGRIRSVIARTEDRIDRETDT